MKRSGGGGVRRLMTWTIVKETGVILSNEKLWGGGG